MIIVHTYCSYKLSPSGFQYGTFEITDNPKEDMYYISNEKDDNTVSSAFDFSIVKRLKGKLPNKSTFVFLFKKISYTYDNEHDDFGGDVSLNMALEFDDFKQFLSFSNGFEEYEKNDPLKLAKILADCIVPDISITRFKYSVHKKRFDDWLKLMFDNSQSMAVNESRFQHQLGILTDSVEKNLYCNDLQEIFNFDTTFQNGDEVAIKHLDDALYIYPVKKKELSHHLKQNKQVTKGNHLLIILAMSLIFFVIVILMIMIPKHNNANAMCIYNDVVEYSDISTINNNN